MRQSSVTAVSCALFCSVSLGMWAPPRAQAQAAPATPPSAAAPAAPATPLPPAAPPSAGVTSPTRPAVAPAASPPGSVLDALSANTEKLGQPITADSVARRAATTSFTVRAQREAIVAAAARVDEAWAQFLPRLTATARYTRLSPLTNPSIGGGGTQLVTPDAPGTPNPRIVAIQAPALTFPVIVDNFLLQAQLAVPISDYFLRINQGYTAASHAEGAARLDASASMAKAATEGKVAFYTHIRAQGALRAAVQALADVKAHAADAKNQELARNASRADVLRAETAVTAAELQVERMKNLVALTEKQVRMAAHLGEKDEFYLAESLETPLPRFEGTVPDLTREAFSHRAELKGIDANIEALRAQGKIARASQWPQLVGAGELTYANPNQRKFPITPEFFPTWSLTLQATWSPNDIPSSMAAGNQVDARIAGIEAQRVALREGIELEVVQAHQQVLESEKAIESTMHQLESATEAMRVAQELFRNGRATATLVIDAETELTRARLEVINAHIEARVARARLEHAVGRDLRYASDAR